MSTRPPDAQSSGDPIARGSISRVLVIVPTYNEIENVASIIERVRQSVPVADILIADDDSPDGTGALADQIAAGDTHVHVRHRAAKKGLGAAYLDGFVWALERDYDVIVEMDADGSHPPEQLPDLLARIGAGADLVIGSRWVDGGAVVNWPRSRELISRSGSLYSRLALGISLRDVTAGYRAFRATTLQKLDLHEVASQGYCFQVDLAQRAIRRGLRVDEVPITFVEREHGVSKMSKSIVVEALWRVTRWGITYRTGQVVGHLRGRRQPPGEAARLDG